MQKVSKQRKFIGMAMSEEQFGQVEGLIVEIVKRKGEIVGKGDVLREGIDRLSIELTGKPIFNETTPTT